SNRKGQLKADLHEKPTSTKPEIASDIIQEMKLV
ncbi:ribosomal subunit interface protein, partial [Vibrio sp. 10N.222.49.E5]